MLIGDVQNLSSCCSTGIFAVVSHRRLEADSKVLNKLTVEDMWKVEVHLIHMWAAAKFCCAVCCWQSCGGVSCWQSCGAVCCWQSCGAICCGSLVGLYVADSLVVLYGADSFVVLCVPGSLVVLYVADSLVVMYVADSLVVLYVADSLVMLCVADSLSADLRDIVYQASVRYGGANNWNFMWQRYKNATMPAEKQTILNALAFTTDANTIQRSVSLRTTQVLHSDLSYHVVFYLHIVHCAYQDKSACM